MTIYRLSEPFTWAKYSKVLKRKILAPKYAGVIYQADIPSEKFRLVVGEEGSVDEGNVIRFYLVIDEEDGVIADVKFQCFGQTALIGAAEVLSALALRKNHAQARRISADLIDHEVRDRNLQPAFPEEASSHLNKVLAALDNALEKCLDIVVQDAYVMTPVHMTAEESVALPNWLELTKEEQLAAVREVVTKDITPYVELDAGGVEVLDIKEGLEVLIGYQGSCTSCHAATGSTLSAIQHILRTKVHPELIVIPDLSLFH